MVQPLWKTVRWLLKRVNVEIPYDPAIILLYTQRRGFPCSASGKEPACQFRRHKRCWFNPWVRKIPWRRVWQPTPAFLPGESHGQRSLGGSIVSQRVRHNWSDFACIHIPRRIETKQQQQKTPHTQMFIAWLFYSHEISRMDKSTESEHRLMFAMAAGRWEWGITT